MMKSVLSVKHTVSGAERVREFANNIEEIAYIQNCNIRMVKEVANLQKYKNPKMFAEDLWRLEHKPRAYVGTQADGTKIKQWSSPKLSTRGENLIDKLDRSYSKYNEIEHGNWRMFNAVTDIVDHGSSEKRMNNGYAMFGSGNALKSRAFNLLFT